MYQKFSEILDKIQFNKGDFSHPDLYQECQDDQECPPIPQSTISQHSQSKDKIISQT